ncbi:MAG: serine/threonine protein kinase [Candidatus Sumerlaeia bacterium]|nr:serine/threonine protein kinase [Candidatus Sumerlaeia bacterium]
MNEGNRCWVPDGYQLIEPLASGGQGETHLARDMAASRIVVIKRMTRGARGLFYRELFSMVVACHPNIVDILDYYDTEDGDRLLVMEYCQGGTLRQYMEDHLFFEAREVVTLMTQLFSATAEIHTEGIVHGDLKPENIFRARRHGVPVWKIGDFGISRHQNDTRQLKACTPAYASPEHFLGKLCCASDVYSLGRLMEECLNLGMDEGYRIHETNQDLRDDLHRLAAECMAVRESERPTAINVYKRLVAINDFIRAERYLLKDARIRVEEEFMNERAAS